MLFIQVNTGREPQKAGVLPEGTDKFIAQCRALDADFRIDVHPAPVAGDPLDHFVLLAELAARNGTFFMAQILRPSLLRRQQ